MERTDGFYIDIIEAPLLSSEPNLPSKEIITVLSQPYFYLAKGRQSFVFQSLDGKYVLKFFNKKYLQDPWYTVFVGRSEKQKRERRRLFFNQSYEIAYNELGDEILYLHRGNSETLPEVFIVDKVKEENIIDLNKIPFVLQRKGIPFDSYLDILYQRFGIEGLYELIDQYLVEIKRRIDKNIADADHDVIHNWGVFLGRVFHLDPGRLYYDDLTSTKRRSEEWDNASRNLYKWLKKRYLPAAEYLKEQVKKNEHLSNSI